MSTMEIAKTILEQIKATDRAALMAWGARNFVSMSEGTFEGHGQLGGIMFMVNGLKFRGKVVIRLMASDTYTIETGRIYKGEWKRSRLVDDIYCDNLVDVIDALIEKKGMEVA